MSSIGISCHSITSSHGDQGLGQLADLLGFFFCVSYAHAGPPASLPTVNLPFTQVKLLSGAWDVVNIQQLYDRT